MKIMLNVCAVSLVVGIAATSAVSRLVLESTRAVTDDLIFALDEFDNAFHNRLQAF